MKIIWQLGGVSPLPSMSSEIGKTTPHHEAAPLLKIRDPTPHQEAAPLLKIRDPTPHQEAAPLLRSNDA